MPTYEYQCHSCGIVFDVMQKLADAPLTVCRCGKNGACTKKISAAGFALKGTGWYATDFKGGGKPAESKAEGAKAEGSTAEAPKADAKTESKAETKADAKPAASAPAPAPAASSTPSTPG
jgi:putative FmdB family regulatory protein